MFEIHQALTSMQYQDLFHSDMLSAQIQPYEMISKIVKLMFLLLYSFKFLFWKIHFGFKRKTDGLLFSQLTCGNKCIYGIEILPIQPILGYYQFCQLTRVDKVAKMMLQVG